MQRLCLFVCGLLVTGCGVDAARDPVENTHAPLTAAGAPAPSPGRLCGPATYDPECPPGQVCDFGNLNPDEPDASVDPDEPDASIPGVGHCRAVAAVCGNAVIEEGEACDDGNVIAGDGCSESCALDDNTSTPGDDRPDYFSCGVTTCVPGELCCTGSPSCVPESVGCPVPGRPLDDCDGPEDCGADESCWVTRSGSFCNAARSGYYVVCHTDDDCATAPCFMSPETICHTCVAGLCSAL
jgi:cysteine-rich repeat protein